MPTNKYYAKHRKSLIQKAREWAEQNKERKVENRRKHYECNREKYIEQAQQWQKDHPEKTKEYKDKNRKSHQAERSEYNRQWRKDHPELLTAKYLRRRARQSKTLSTLTSDDIREMKKSGCFFADHTCKGHLAIAHDVPLSKGGNSTRANTFVLCQKHNSEMGTKSLKEMLIQKDLDL